MYWRIGSFLELQHLSDEDRARLLRKHAGWRTLVCIVVCALSFGFLAGMIATLLTAVFLSRSPAAVLALGAGFFALLSVVAYQAQLIWLRSGLRAFLADEAQHSALPLCIHCGYNVQGLASNRCPECGQVLPETSEAKTRR